MPRGKRTDPALLAEAVRLARASGDWTAAAQACGIAKSTLYAERKRLERLETERRAKRAAAESDGESKPSGSDSESSDDDDETASELDFEQLDELVTELQERFRALPDGSPRLGPIATVLSACITRRAKLRPPPAPDPAEAEARRRREEGEVVADILRTVSAYEDEAREKGCCLWCGQHLSPELAAKLHGDPPP